MAKSRYLAFPMTIIEEQPLRRYYSTCMFSKGVFLVFWNIIWFNHNGRLQNKRTLFFEPSLIHSLLVSIDRVDQDDQFDTKLTSVGWPPPTQFILKVPKIGYVVPVPQLRDRSFATFCNQFLKALSFGYVGQE